MQMKNVLEKYGIPLPQLVGQRIQHTFTSYGLGTIKKAYIAEDMRVYVDIQFDSKPNQIQFSLTDMLGKTLVPVSETIDGVPVSAIICRAEKKMREKLEDEAAKRQAKEKERLEEERKRQAREKERLEEERKRQAREKERLEEERMRKLLLESIDAEYRRRSEQLKENERCEKEERQKIYNYFTKERGVEYFVHFTPEENIPSILQHGIIPREDLSAHRIDARCPDQSRSDNHLDYSSFSVSFPNYRVMYSKRDDMKFVVLCIDPRIILDFPISDISYLPTNAANQSLPKEIEEYIGFSAAEGIFSETAYNHKTGASCQRSELNIPGNFSTDPQAEVFVRATVEPKYIREIICKDNSQGLQILDVLCEHGLEEYWREKTFIYEAYFDMRSDYKFWKSPQRTQVQEE